MATGTLVGNLLEIFSYAISFGAFYLFVWFAMAAVKKPEVIAATGWMARLMRSCVVEKELLEEEVAKEAKAAKTAEDPSQSFLKEAMHLISCILGIQVSYLLWGLMQERIMQQPYESGENFNSSKFLVFANRFLALAVAYVAHTVQERQGQGTPLRAPLYKFSFSSVSNIMSSVCQYEALKYVSFPTQVLAKSCKMVPVMLMGYVVSGRRYEGVEYVIAVMITAGASIFKLFEPNDGAPVQNTEFVGIILIVGYMVCDSFTSNWQSKVFKQYGVGSISMMMYANLFSSGFTALGLVVTLEILEVIAFIAANPSVITHLMIMSVCSAVGQLFIFHTIKQYGPLIFATIQTVRQLLSIVLSIVFFGHPVNAMEALGILIVFVALGGQIAHGWLKRKRKQAAAAIEPAATAAGDKAIAEQPPEEPSTPPECDEREVQDLLSKAEAKRKSDAYAL